MNQCTQCAGSGAFVWFPENCPPNKTLCHFCLGQTTLKDSWPDCSLPDSESLKDVIERASFRIKAESDFYAQHQMLLVFLRRVGPQQVQCCVCREPYTEEWPAQALTYSVNYRCGKPSCIPDWPD